MQVVALILLILTVVALGPLLVLWALNTVFPVLAIPYTIKTWLAILVLGGFIKSNVEVKDRRK